MIRFMEIVTIIVVLVVMITGSLFATILGIFLVAYLMWLYRIDLLGPSS